MGHGLLPRSTTVRAMSEPSVTTAGRLPQQHDPPERLPELPFVALVIDEESAETQQSSAGDPFTALSQLVEALRSATMPCRGVWALHPDWPEAIALPIRYRHGVVGESRRVEHRVSLQPGQWHGETVTAGCGAELALSNLEVVEQFATAPCPRCVASIRLPGTWS